MIRSGGPVSEGRKVLQKEGRTKKERKIEA